MWYNIVELCQVAFFGEGPKVTDTLLDETGAFQLLTGVTIQAIRDALNNHQEALEWLAVTCPDWRAKLPKQRPYRAFLGPRGKRKMNNIDVQGIERLMSFRKTLVAEAEQIMAALGAKQAEIQAVDHELKFLRSGRIVNSTLARIQANQVAAHEASLAAGAERYAEERRQAAEAQKRNQEAEQRRIRDIMEREQRESERAKQRTQELIEQGYL